MIRYILAVILMGGIALQLVWTVRDDRYDESRDHVEPLSHVHPMRWAIVDEDEAS